MFVKTSALSKYFSEMITFLARRVLDYIIMGQTGDLSHRFDFAFKLQ
jgi:hypothetical protein